MKKKFRVIATFLLCTCLVFTNLDAISINSETIWQNPTGKSTGAQEAYRAAPAMRKKAAQSDRFIVKHKYALDMDATQWKNEFLQIINTEVAELTEIKGTENAYVLALNERVDIDGFISTVMSNNAKGLIESIQNDYILSLADIGEENADDGLAGPIPDNSIYFSLAGVSSDYINSGSPSKGMEPDSPMLVTDPPGPPNDSDHEDSVFETDQNEPRQSEPAANGQEEWSIYNDKDVDVDGFEDENIEGIEDENANEGTEENLNENEEENEGEDEDMAPLEMAEEEYGLDKVIIAVIDNSVDIAHKDLSNHIFVNHAELPKNAIDDDGNGYVDDINGWNFVDGNNDVSVTDTSFSEEHGTFIAGIVLGLCDVKYGDLSNSGTVVLPLKAFSGRTAFTSNIIEAINYANSMGAKIITASWAGFDENPALEQAMASSDALFVCAAGNNSLNIDETPVYPASYNLPNVISVTSAKDDGGLCYFSNYGENTVDIAAPGWDIYSTTQGGGYGVKTGTSVSAAFVAATAARILGDNHGLAASGLKSWIIGGGDKVSNLDGIVKQAAMLNHEFAVLGQANNAMKQSPALNSNRAIGKQGGTGQPMRSGPNVSLSGSGTPSDPYLISSAADFDQVHNDLQAHYKMTNDIDLGNQEFVPIGNYSMPFEGAFDGGGNEISSFYISTFSDSPGMFGYVFDAEILNIKIQGANVMGDHYAGILAGNMYASTIAGCEVSGAVSVGTSGGGLIGYSYDSSISRCGADIEIDAYDLYGSATIGGLVGFTSDFTIISDCFAIGNINGNYWGNAGGLAGGSSYNETITNSYAVCDISVLGINNTSFIYGGSAANCYYSIETWPGDDFYAEGKTNAELMMQSTFVGWDFVYVWDIDEGNSFPFFQKPVTPPAFGIAFQVSQNNEYLVAVNGKNITSSNAIAIEVTYDSAKLQLLDAAAHIHGTFTSPGSIPDTEVSIAYISSNSLAMHFNKAIPYGKSWSGAITVLKFKALASGSTTVSVEYN